MLRRRFALLYGVVFLTGLVAAVGVVVASPTVEEAIPKVDTAAPQVTTAVTNPPPKEATRLPTLDVRVSGVDLLRVGTGPAELPADVRDRVVGVVTDYVQRATVEPMTTGRPAEDVSDLFTGGAERRVRGADRASLVDEGLPAARPVGRPAADLHLTALAGAGGVVELVTVRLLVEVRGMTGDGRAVQVNRVGELTLAPVSGHRWRIESFAVSVERGVEEAG